MSYIMRCNSLTDIDKMLEDFLQMARDTEEYNLNLKLVDRALNTEPD